MSLKIKSYAINLLQLGILTIISMVIIFINDTYFKTNFIKYFDLLRLIDHLISGIYVPLTFHFLFNNIYLGISNYFLLSTYWEIKQFLERGFFQYNQYICDLIGIVLAIIISRCLKKREQYN